METETTTWSEFPNEGKATRKQIVGSNEKYWNKKYWAWKSITEFTRSISTTIIGQPVFMTDVKVSQDKYISRCVEKLYYPYFLILKAFNCSHKY